jgi:hypothetical protein
MIGLPHRPDASRLEAARAAVEGFLKRAEARLPVWIEERRGEFVVSVAHQRLNQALLRYVAEEGRPAFESAVRGATGDFCRALEMGFVPLLPEARMFFLAALAVADRPSAQFIASLPPEPWRETPRAGMRWRSLQLDVLFALFKDGDETAGIRLEEIRAIEAFPEGLQAEVPAIRNECRLLDAIRTKDAAALDAALGERMAILEASFLRNGRNGPWQLMDLEGLGICRLARDRGLRVQRSHPYLPVDWLNG